MGSCVFSKIHWKMKLQGRRQDQQLSWLSLKWRSDVLWITFAEGRMWWCFADTEVIPNCLGSA